MRKENRKMQRKEEVENREGLVTVTGEITVAVDWSVHMWSK
jgi:hypothetical protein